MLETEYLFLGVALADAAVPWVITQWHRFANKTEFVALQETALVYYEQHSTLAKPWGWVGDVRHMGAILAEAQRWLQEDFNPRAGYGPAGSERGGGRNHLWPDCHPVLCSANDEYIPAGG